MSTLYLSAVIDATVDRVWSVARDFNGLPSWVPAIAKSRIEGDRPSDAVGCVRELQLQDGAHLRERLLALSDRERSLTYTILEGPLPVKDYIATFSFRPITEGSRTLAEWTADFAVTAGEERDMEELLTGGVIGPGFARLNEMLAAH